MNHKAIVKSDGRITASQKFDYLCDAVSFCNENATKGDSCEVVEVIQSLTGEDKLGTIAAWDYNKEYNS